MSPEPSNKHKAASSIQVIVVNYETEPLLLECLASLDAQRTSVSMEICVVDNSPVDRISSVLPLKAPSVRLIRPDANIGFAGAINAAAAQSTTDFLLVLNADVVVVPDCVEVAIEWMQMHPDVGLVGPELTYPSGDLQESCRRFYTLTSILLRRTPLGHIFPNAPSLRQHLMRDFDHQEPRDVDWVMGAAFFMRRTALDAADGFDERYFLYFEDVDICRRLAAAGWRIVYLPSAKIVHHHQRRSYTKRLWDRDLWWHILSSLKYFCRWRPAPRLARAFVKHALPISLVVSDAIGIFVALWGAYQLRLILSCVFHNPLFPFTQYTIFAEIVVATTIMLLLLARTYGSHRCILSWDSMCRMVTSLALSFGLFIILSTMMNDLAERLGLSRMVIAVALLLAIPAMTIGRLCLFAIQRILWRNHLGLTRVAFLGFTPGLVPLLHPLGEAETYGYELTGYAHVEGMSQELPLQPAMACLGTWEVLVADLTLDEVVCPAAFLPREGAAVISLLENGVTVRFVLENGCGSNVIESRHIDSFLGYESGQREWGMTRRLALISKRLFDCALASVMLVASLPLMAWCAWRIRREDGGPAIFRQERVGRGGKLFTMWKFRTMRATEGGCVNQNAEPSAAALLGKVYEDRVTKTGRVLRRWDLDELPQLINVIRGEMSLVGPRPPIVSEAACYAPWQEARFAMLPGMTGEWQVYKDRQWEFMQMLRLDIRYILNWSLLRDVQLLFLTPAAVFQKGKLATNVSPSQMVKEQNREGPPFEAENGDRCVDPRQESMP